MTSATGFSGLSYNAESQLATASGVTYTYDALFASRMILRDGDGKRVKKSNGSNGTLYWYGAGSDPLDETDLTGVTTNPAFKEYVFFAGKRIARRDSSNNVNYYFADHLGTARVVASSTGAILDDSDFYPFGGERIVSSSSGNHYKFTGKERDSESGLDDFGARFYGNTLGRFLSPDVPLLDQHPRNPQSWNLYSYARNDPLVFNDPTGNQAGSVISSGTNGDPGGGGMSAEEVTAYFAQADEEQKEQLRAHQAQNQTITLGDIKVEYTPLARVEVDGMRGVTIDAYPQGCDDCRWTQTVSRTGNPTMPEHTDREKADQPLYPAQPAPKDKMNGFSDAPASRHAGTFTAVTTLGIADQNTKTFTVKGSMTWGYSRDEKGNVTPSGPRVATAKEQARSIEVLRHESPGWTIQ